MHTKSDNAIAISHVLYAGKGGHGSVVHSLISADKSSQFVHQCIYIGVEEMDADYIHFCTKNHISFQAIRKQKGKHLRSWIQLYRTYKKQRPEIVCLNSLPFLIPTLWYCLLHRIPCIPVEHQSNHAKRKSEWFWSFIALSFCKSIVYLSSQYLDEMKQKWGKWFKFSAITIIPNGIDISEFSPRKDSLPTGELRMGMAARLTPLRDPITILHAIAQLLPQFPKLQFHLAGAGEERAKIEKEIKRLGIAQHCFLHGNLNQTELIIFLQNLDIYVHSSFAETMSTSLLQAMAVGLPIIASQIPGNIELICENETGLFFPIQNIEVLKARIRLLIENPSFANQLGSNARLNCITHYSNYEQFEAYSKLFLKTYKSTK